MTPQTTSGNSLTRRTFLKTCAVTAGGLALGACASTRRAGRSLSRPNILFIQSDQLAWHAVSANGCGHVRTPNIDRLMARGVTFDLSYSANPVCCPARSVWYTGRTSSETGVVSNNTKILNALPDLGQWLAPRGYEPVYIGKWHIPGRACKESFKLLNGGFSYGEHGDDAIARTAQGFFRNYRGARPFFLSLGFLQPHDICYWPLLNPTSLPEIPFRRVAELLPPLPPNHGADPREPAIIGRLNSARFRGKWSELHWRYYRWAYFRSVEMVDAQVGRILDSLEDSGRNSDTVVIFSSDHGDGMGAHGLIAKPFFYEEAARVPMVISCPGYLPEGVRDERHLVSGLDFAPTVCDFAGVEPPPKARGMSLKPLALKQGAAWRDFIVSESATTGRMVRTADFKHITYRGDSASQLFDLRADPGETHNLAGDPAQAGTVANLKRSLAQWEQILEPAPLPATAPKSADTTSM